MTALKQPSPHPAVQASALLKFAVRALDSLPGFEAEQTELQQVMSRLDLKASIQTRTPTTALH